MTDVLLLGNPNSGKTLLFNRLTGLTQKVANFPGVTVEIKSGKSGDLNFHDFPGVYSLKPLTEDEKIAIEGFKNALTKPDLRAVVCVLDGTRLERSLYLLLQLKEVSNKFNCPLIAAVNVMDEVQISGSSLDIEGLERELQIPFFGVSAKTKKGIREFESALAKLELKKPLMMESIASEFEKFNSRSEIILLKTKAHELSKAFGPKSQVFLKTQNQLDRFFLSTWGGPIVFSVLMYFMFQAIFAWAAPFMDALDMGIGFVAEWTTSHLPEGIFADFVRDAIFAGLGSFLVFVPQIFILFLVIGLLEDTGYLARAAVILHKPLRWFGLSGRSFVPLLSGHACAIPAIMSARTIESPRRRLLTILAAPFMSCSARLPVYALFVGGFVPATSLAGGLIGLQGFVFFLLFFLGIFVGLMVTATLDKFWGKSKDKRLADAPFIVELPPYRLPGLKPILQSAYSRSLGFVKNAGGIIFAVSVVVWILGYFPNGSGHLDTSWLASLGKMIDPVFSFIGMNWKIGVAVLTSFLAREVFVGTLGTLYGIEAADENLTSLTDALQSSGMSLATAVALMVFYSLSMQCVSTLAVMKKETGSLKIPVLVFIGMTAIAYLFSAGAYFLTELFF